MKLVIALALIGLGTAHASPKVIYGDDNRLDLYDVQNPMLALTAESTVALFQSNKVVMDQSRGIATLQTTQYGATAQLCTTERFFEQPMGAFCSGFLVAPDIIATAGHCITDQADCMDTKFVFGYSMPSMDANPSMRPMGEVYGCSQLIARRQSASDWALVRLDRPVTNHEPLRLNRTGMIPVATSVVVIGHPVGIPVKVSGGANVRSTSNSDFFVANLDTYGGNSGSAVVNEMTGEVEGILVRGERDFVTRGNCRVSNVCTNEGCSGEDVTKINTLLASLPSQ